MTNTQNYNQENTYDLNSIMSIIGQTAQLTKGNAESTAVIMEELQQTKSLLGGVTNKVNLIKDGLESVAEDVNILKLSEEITTNQNENITTAVKRRIFEILGDDQYELKKYSKMFYQRLYSDARKNANMGSKVSRTRKRDYQTVLDYVEAWTPIGGCAALKLKADLAAQARKLAKTNGYT